MAALLLALALSQASSPAFADSIREKQWHLNFLKISEAHKISKGAGITVAIVDTGAEKHPDLVKNLKPGMNLASGGSPVGQSDEDGHGTAMTGLIAGHGRNSGDGILGIAPEAEAIPVKVAGPGDGGRIGGVQLPKGIEWAAQNGAEVINVSASIGPSVAMADAISAAEAADAVVVAATGNRPDFLQLGYPAAAPGVLAVGAVDKSGKHASFSVEGDAIQICAPGDFIESTGLKGEYRLSRGTSDSTAIVSGAAALVRAKFPDLDAQDVINRLTSTATDIGPPGRDKECGFGVLNIVKALTADVPPLEGSSGESASPAPDSAPTPDDTGTATDPAPEDASNTTAIVAGTVGGVVVLVGALVAFLVLRRRRS